MADGKEIALSTFIKLLELGEKARRAEFRRLNAGGGYPYWQPLRDNAADAVKAGADLNALVKQIEKKCSGHQRTYNKNALVTLGSWAQARNCIPVEPPPLLTVPFGTSGISVRLQPDVSFQLNGITVSMVVWATTKPLLSDDTLSVALLFIRGEYEQCGITNRLMIFDTIKKRQFTEMDILASAPALLVEKKELFKKNWKEATGVPPASPPPPSSGVHPSPLGP